MASVTDLYSSLHGQRFRQSEKGEREKTSKTRGVYACEIWKKRYVSESMETKYLNVDS